MSPEGLAELMFMAGRYEFDDRLLWGRFPDTKKVYVLCNDVFIWGAADSEEVTDEDLPLLRQSVEDMEDGENGMVLYCARKRHMRPQGAVYLWITEDKWPLLHACGEERETGPGNPYAPGELTAGKHQEHLEAVEGLLEKMGREQMRQMVDNLDRPCWKTLSPEHLLNGLGEASADLICWRPGSEKSPLQLAAKVSNYAAMFADLLTVRGSGQKENDDAEHGN